jgi:hypothetical protein
LRAAAAMAGIYGNSPSEAVYPLLATDSTGNKPDTSTNRYTLTFPEGGLPPVEAFWSVTMYDGKTQLLIVNPINRYLINSPMLPDLKKNSDGSISLHIRKDLAWRRQGVELAAGPRWSSLRGDAALLAEGRLTFGLQWHLETAARAAGPVTHCGSSAQ